MLGLGLSMDRYHSGPPVFGLVVVSTNNITCNVIIVAVTMVSHGRVFSRKKQRNKIRADRSLEAA